MPSWVVRISDIEPPRRGFWRPLQRTHATGGVSTHTMSPRPRTPSAPCFFIYTGTGASSDPRYPHITVMLEAPLHQKAGLLFFRSSEFHVSLRSDTKMFYAARPGATFVEEGGQSGLISSAEARQMASDFIAAINLDITSGITPAALDDGWASLRSGVGLRPWEWDALQRQNLENDQARLRVLGPMRDEAWARQFEWPEDA